jgi:hypothetical protein
MEKRQGTDMIGNENKTRPGWKEPEQGQGWKNMGKIIFLIVVLVAAWFVLEWLIEGK